MKRYLFVILALLQTVSTHAQDGGVSTEKDESKSLLVTGNTDSWFAEGVSLKNSRQFVLYPVKDNNKRKLPAGFLEHQRTIIKKKLQSAGVRIVPAAEDSKSTVIKLIPVVTKYEPGSVGDRWIAPGMGVTICIMRMTLFRGKEVIGEIISWQQVAGGGLFSIGADEYVPEETAKEIARALLAKVRK